MIPEPTAALLSRGLDALTLGEVQQTVDVGRRDVDIHELRLERRARVARCNEYAGHPCRLRALPREGMFAAAAANDQDLHQ